MKALASRFIDESSLELHSFLCAPLADKLRSGLKDKDEADGLGRAGLMSWCERQSAGPWE